VRDVPVKREEGKEQAGEGDEAWRVKQIPPLRGRRSRSRAEKKTGRSVRDDRLGRAAMSDLKVRPPKRRSRRDEGDLRLTREGGGRMVLRRVRVEIGISR